MKGDILYKQPSIYIADDDEDDVYLVKMAVEELRSDIELKHFHNGKQLLNALEDSTKHPPSFVLLDLNMPVLDGKQTLKLIRQNKKFGALPVIILSTAGQEEEREVCYKYGATKYITKPYQFAKYLELMKLLKLEWIDHVTV